MKPASGVASATVARTASSSSARAAMSAAMSCGFLRATRASPNAALVATSPNSARRAGSNCTTGSAPGHSERAAAAKRAASSSRDGNAKSSVVVGFIASDLRRAVHLLQHERASPFVQERERREGPADVGPSQERVRSPIRPRDHERDPRDPLVRQPLDPPAELLAGDQLAGAFQQPDVIGRIEQLEDRVAFGANRPCRVGPVSRPHLDLVEPVIRPNARAKIRERIGDVALADLTYGDEPDVQAAVRAAAARIFDGKARSFSVAKSRAIATSAGSSTSMISNAMISSSGVTSMSTPSQLESTSQKGRSRTTPSESRKRGNEPSNGALASRYRT